MSHYWLREGLLRAAGLLDIICKPAWDETAEWRIRREIHVRKCGAIL